MNDKLSIKTKLAYACGDAGCCLITYVSINYFTFYMTNMIGMTLAAAAAVVFISRLWDAANDIIVGVFVDRTFTPKGKARPWIKRFIIPLAIAAILCFSVPNGLPQAGKFAWTVIAFCLFTLFYTTVNLPYGAMLPLMTKNGAERTQLASFRLFGAIAGIQVLQAGFLPLVKVIADGLFDGERVYAYTLACIVFTIVGGIVLFMLYLGCPEKVYEEQMKLDEAAGITLEDKRKLSKKASNPLKDVSYLFRNPPWVLVFCIMFLSFLVQPLMTVGLPYFYVYFLQMDETGSALFSVATGFTMLVGVFAAPLLVKKFDYKMPCIVCTFISAILGFACFFLGQNITAIIVCVAIANAFAGVLGVAGLAMLGDAIEFGDWKFDRRLEGLGTAAYSFSTKAGPAIGNLMVSGVLAFAGLNTALTINDRQPDSALFALQAVMFIIPNAARIIQCVLLFFYPLTRSKYVKVLEEIDARNKARAKDAPTAEVE